MTKTKIKITGLVSGIVLLFIVSGVIPLISTNDGTTSFLQPKLSTSEISIETPLDGKAYTSVNMEPQTHGVYHFPSTYSFEGDASGTTPPTGWSVTTNGAGYCKVVDEIADHHKVVEFYDNVNNYGKQVIMDNVLTTPQGSGTIEFYVRFDTKDHTRVFDLYDGTTKILHLFWKLGFVQYNDGSNHEITSFEKNRWYHIEIRFDLVSGGNDWHLWIDGVPQENEAESQDFGYITSATTIDTVSFRTGTRNGLYFYYWVDAIGYSWDPYYHVGNNILDVGHYPATYGFESDQVGSEPNSDDWEIVSENPTVEVISELVGHKKVLSLYDTVSASGQSTRVANSFSAKDYGTVEVWILQDSFGDTQKRAQITGMNGDDLIFQIRTVGGTTPKWQARDGSSFVDITGAPTPTANTWYHVSIDFTHLNNDYENLDQNHYQVRINRGVAHGQYDFNVIDQVDELHLHTYSYGYNYKVYFDALGYDWDESNDNYESGDNFNEGILVSFTTPISLPTLWYELDGTGTQTTRSISGDFVIPINEFGSRTIQICGKDSSQNYYESELRTFHTIQPLEVADLDTGVAYQHSDLYPATYGFDFDELNAVPSGTEWSTANTGNAYTKVIESVDDHDYVLECADGGNSGGYSISNNFENQESGTVEFYIRVSDSTNNAFYWALSSSTDIIIWLSVVNNELIYWDGTSWIDFPELQFYFEDNRWYDITIDFQCEDLNYDTLTNPDTFQICIDGNDDYLIDLKSYPKSFIVPCNTISKFSIFSFYEFIENQKCWIDAIGYSWDDYYDRGDNLEEGLKLEISGAEQVQNLECAIDGTGAGSRREIPGDCIIPLPHGESHIIQVFGQYVDDIWTRSSLYQIDMIGEKIAVFLWGSDIQDDWFIDTYVEVLELAGYTKFYMFKDSYEPVHDLRIVERFETGVDTLYIHSSGHGSTASHETSTALYVNGQLPVADFKNIMIDVETDRKAWMFDLCHGGHFVTDFSDVSYSFLAISSTDYKEESGGWNPPGERWFSRDFYWAIDFGYNADGAFNHADAINWFQEAQKDNNCPSYDFFW